MAGSLKIALALSGGAGRGAFHLGVLQAIEDAGIEVACISGNSIGSIVGCSYASGTTPKEILEVFKSKSFKKTLKFNYFRKSLLRVDNSNEINEKLFKDKTAIEQLNIPMTVHMTDIDKGELLGLKKGSIVKSVAASSAVWPIMPVVEIEGRRCIDGGFFNNLPFETLKAEQLPIFAVNLHPNYWAKKKGFWSTLIRTFFISWQSSVISQQNQYDLYITDPRLQKISLFTFKDSQKAFELGLEAGKEKIEAFLKQKNKTLQI